MDAETPRRRLLRIRVDSVMHGFFAQVNYVLNQLLHAEREDLTPFVLLEPQLQDGPNPYYEPGRGENVWEQFFEPVSDVDWRTVDERDAVALAEQEIISLSAHHPDSVYLYPYHRYRHKVRYDAEWYAQQRRRANRLLSQYVRVRPEILARLAAAERELFTRRPVLGLHLRGTDKRQVGNHRLMARVIPPREYRPLVHRFLSEHPDGLLFVATDQAQFLETLKGYFPGRVVHARSRRSAGRGRGSAVFEEWGNGYEKGVEVLVDALLLSRCDRLLKCASAVGAFATFWNPDMPAVDMNHVYATEARIRLYDAVAAAVRPIRRRLGLLR